MTRPHRSPHRRAVTLVEVLVTIGVTVILTLILITGLRAVRGQALAMKDLNNLRLSGQDLLLWSTENDSKFLNIETPDSTVYRDAYSSFGPQTFWSFYYSQPIGWNHILGTVSEKRHEHWHSPYGLPEYPDNMASMRDGAASLRESGNSAWTLTPSRYHYSLTLVTRPTLWVPPTQVPTHVDLAEYAMVGRLSNVTFPSSKGILVNHQIPDEPDRYHALFADGSTSLSPGSSPIASTHQPFSANGDGGVAVLHTLYGHEGRDR